MTDRKKIYCNACKQDTNHILKGWHERNYVETDIDHDGDEYPVLRENWLYQFWVCLGCDTATMIEQYHCPDMPLWHDKHGPIENRDTTYHPQRIYLNKRTEKTFLHIPSRLRKIYKEIIAAYQQEMNLLCAVGLRALLEGICISEGINDEIAYNLLPGKDPQKKPGKLNTLKDKCNIPQDIIDSLCKMAVFGNDATHKLDATSQHDISLAIDLIEALLTTLYEARLNLEYKAKSMKGESIPLGISLGVVLEMPE